MMTSEQAKDYELSRRGQIAASEPGLALIFEILAKPWDAETRPDGYVSLGVAENDLMHSTLVEYVNRTVEIVPRSLTYGVGGQGSVELRSAIAHFLNRHLHPIQKLDAEQIIATNGCSSAIEHCSHMLANPGDGILLGQPYYTTFLADIEMRPGAKVVPVKFGAVDPMSLEGVACYEQALAKAKSEGVKVRALMLCNPHNPLGRCYSREVIIELMKLCQKHGMHLVSDEIYALSTWKNDYDTYPPPVTFVSATSIDLTGIIDPHRVHVLWGLSKDFGANGLRLGAIISQYNPSFLDGIKTVALYSYPSSLVDVVVRKLLVDDAFTDMYLAENSRKLSAQYETAVQFMVDHKIEYAPGANAAFFLWVNIGKAYADRHAGLELAEQDLFQKLLDQKVFIATGTAFGSEHPGWFRLVFSQEDKNLLEGLRRIEAAIEG